MKLRLLSNIDSNPLIKIIIIFYKKMKTKIDITKYVHVDEIYWGRECKSLYNHNYYYSSDLCDVILEECDDDGYFEYWRLIGYTTQRLGGYYGVGGIFEDEVGIVELDNYN